MSPAQIDAARKLAETYSAAGAREMPRALLAALDALVAAEAERDSARGVAQLAVEERDAAERMALAADIRSLRAGAAAWMQRRLVDAYRDERDRMRVERDALRKQLARAQDELDAYRDAHRGRATP